MKSVKQNLISIKIYLIIILITSFGINELKAEISENASMSPCNPNILSWTRHSKFAVRSDDIFKVKADNCGNVYAAGISDDNGNLTDIFIIKYGSAGDTLWHKIYNGLDSGSVSQDKFGDLVVDSSGNVYVCSAAPTSTGGYDYVAMKFNTDGILQWIKRLNFKEEDVPMSACIDNSNNFIVTGYVKNSGLEGSYMTVKYNSIGDTVWTKNYTGDNNDASTARSVCADTMGNIYVTGNSAKFAQGNDFVTIKYNSAGSILWTKRYNSPLGNSQDIPVGIMLDASSNVYVTGYSDSVFVGSPDYLTLKYNSNGDVQWVSRYSAPGNLSDYALSLAVGSTGNVAVTGYSMNASGNYDMLTLMYNSSGIKQWEKRQTGTGNYHDVGRAVIFNSSGDIYVAGNLFNATSDAVIFKYSSTGAQKGYREFAGSYNKDDVFRSICIDKLENVFAAGRMNYSNFDCVSLTKKYSQSEFNFILKLNAILEGFHYSSSTPFMRPDSLMVYIRSANSPYTILDSSKQKLNNIGYSEFYFRNIQIGTGYLISVNHRNSIETWSATASPLIFNSDTASYNFTSSANKAFGNNLKQVNLSPVRFAIYSGDVNQDGNVDLTDVSSVYNNSISFLTGYVVTDLNGDNVVDLTDLTIGYNNSVSFVSVMKP